MGTQEKQEFLDIVNAFKQEQEEHQKKQAIRYDLIEKWYADQYPDANTDYLFDYIFNQSGDSSVLFP